MEISPQRVRTAEFNTAKRGLDPDEVRAFLNEVADELERAQNQSTAMEARARAAVARLQELSEGAETQQTGRTEADEPTPSADQAETISRTLILAQRTADTTVAEARSEAERITASANEEASRTLETTREMSARLLDEAREEARRVGEAERMSIESEVNSLLARRDFLESDVDHLQQFLVDERSRLRDAAAALVELTERVPGGLGEVRRPLLSASSEPADAATTTTTTAASWSDTAGVAEPATAVEPDTGDAGDAADLGDADLGDAADDRSLLPGDDDDLVIITDISDDDTADADDESTGVATFSYDDTGTGDDTPPGSFRFGN